MRTVLRITHRKSCGFDDENNLLGGSFLACGIRGARKAAAFVSGVAGKPYLW
ncbi:hypothetical protein IF2G_03290 [Cordyceps javanica]|nr:hypothetical protein IF2G_03290 [Cordyceps javanica]